MKTSKTTICSQSRPSPPAFFERPKNRRPRSKAYFHSEFHYGRRFLIRGDHHLEKKRFWSYFQRFEKTLNSSRRTLLYSSRAFRNKFRASPGFFIVVEEKRSRSKVNQPVAGKTGSYHAMPGAPPHEKEPMSMSCSAFLLFLLYSVFGFSHKPITIELDLSKKLTMKCGLQIRI